MSTATAPAPTKTTESTPRTFKVTLGYHGGYKREFTFINRCGTWGQEYTKFWICRYIWGIRLPLSRVTINQPDKPSGIYLEGPIREWQIPPADIWEHFEEGLIWVGGTDIPRVIETIEVHGPIAEQIIPTPAAVSQAEREALIQRSTGLVPGALWRELDADGTGGDLCEIWDVDFQEMQVVFGGNRRVSFDELLDEAKYCFHAIPKRKP